MKEDSLLEQKKNRLVSFGTNIWFIEELFSQYQKDPSSVSESWQDFFSELTDESVNGHEQGKDRRKGAVKQQSKPDEQSKQKLATDGEVTIGEADEVVPIRGVQARILENMEDSLTIPSATSQRAIPVKIMEENRKLINHRLRINNRGKVSFTHIIAWAIVKALQEFPQLNAVFAVGNGTPQLVRRKSVNFGLAVDVERKDGSRSLVVPNIKKADKMNFREFVSAYDEIITKVRQGKIEPADFQSTTITLTNPGTVGTIASLPRLMTGQGAIVATGAINYPAEYHGMTPDSLSAMGLSKVMNVTCTYDHRIIQGAESGQFLGRIHELLLGKDDFYEDMFADLKMPHKPVSWSEDTSPVLTAIPNREQVEKQARVMQLINLYRVRGHLIANLDPLSDEVYYHAELDPTNYGLTIWDLDREFFTGGLGGISSATLREILDILKQTYCEKIGVEYMHIQHPEEKAWLQERMEPTKNKAELDESTKRHIFWDLTSAEGFEKFMHTKFIGHKRFSLEGAEVVIPILGYLLTQAARQDAKEAVIGMAHRGRLNVLANIIKKPYQKIFSEFQGNIDPQSVHGSGDVKYHLGAAGIFKTKHHKEISVTVAPNPSHLEAVNPVVEGIVRAKQDRMCDAERTCVVPILIHGDAAFAGQGVVAETLNLSQLKGYRTGGTVHIIINNQIGFTTTPEEARSTPYATDVAKMVQAPIFHVNGDDPEAAMRVTDIAFAYRQRFKKDVVIDVVCYRRHGHNEGDEPSYTQPIMYHKIEEHPSVRDIYLKILVHEGMVSEEDAKEMMQGVRTCLEESFEEAQKKKFKFEPDVPLAVSQEEIKKAQPAAETWVEMELLDKIIEGMTSFPGGFKVHPKLAPQFEKRKKMLLEDKKVDWALAEALAFGSLLCEGIPVRLCGEDSTRGTFSQRHLILTDMNTGEEYFPLNNIMPEQAQMQAYDSLLSENAALGFEFGYTVADPLTLVIWEAQFGDFANGAQVVIDNFIASSEAKWQQPCDLVMLLPHGQEGQGPEHSSARLERVLQLCAENNLQVCHCSTPAQYFHVLRRQMKDEVRRPLILMTPKSLLRHPLVISSPQELIDGRFHEILDDTTVKKKSDIKRLLLCSGKVYYDLFKYRESAETGEVAIVRLEQFYPYPEEQIVKTLQSYSHVKEVIWVQEEPKNMGAWNFLRNPLLEKLQSGQTLRYVGRPESASPATGMLKVHHDEQKKLVEAAFAK